MKFRSLAMVPLLFAAGLSVVALLAGEHGAGSALIAENELGKMIAAGGCLAAALAFDRGDYLRRAWMYSGLCYALLLLGDLAAMPAVGSHLGPRALDLVQATLAVLANATSVVGTWMLARAWSISGLDDDDGRARTRRRLLFGAGAVLALLITGWPLAHDVRALAEGDVGALVSIASDLGDALCLALVAPVMQTALAMRGGLLLWPWGMLTISGVAWLLYDAGSSLVEVTHAGAPAFIVATEALRAIACGYVLTAGLAQRQIATGGERLSGSLPGAS
jgi:hypothetical protein